MPYRLMPDPAGSNEVVHTLEALLEGARKGEVTGIAFVCTFKRLRYTTDVAGTCRTNPTFARGMVAFLSDQIAALVHRSDNQETR